MTPTLEQLPQPQFEADVKRASNIKVSKVVTGPVIEGTSVAPRQRPKGNVSQPLAITSNLSIVLGSSPTNIPKKSQSPVSLPENTITQTVSNFQNQFSPQNSTVVFSPEHSFPTTFPPPNTASSGEGNFDTLFQSSVYPDPFRDESLETPGSLPPTNTLHTVPHSTSLSGETCVISPHSVNFSPVGQNVTQSTSQCIPMDSPPDSPTLNVPKGHRRNMSDTTAFNK